MKKKKVDEIMTEVISTWEKRHGKENIDLKKIELVRKGLLMSPHEDGLMPVHSIDDGKTRLVPMVEIILNGFRGKDIDKYPEVKNGEK